MTRAAIALAVVLLALVATARATGCQGYMGTVAGSFSAPFNTPGFNTQMNCTYIFNPGVPIFITAALVNTDPYSNDKVMIFAGVNQTTQANLLVTVTYAFSLPSCLPTNSTAVTVVVVHEAGKRGAGRFANVNFQIFNPLSMCANGSTTVVSSYTYWGNFGATSSISQGNYYPPNWYCRFILTASPATQRPYIYYVQRSLGPLDSVVVTDIGGDGINRTLAPSQNTFYGSNSSLLVEFFSSPNTPGTYAGFIFYSPTIATTTVTLCSGTAPLATAASGNISNIMPLQLTSIQYAANTYCAFPVQVADGNVIIFQGGQTNTELLVDVVTIYDGQTTSSPRLAAYSGSQVPDRVVTSTNQALVVFTSDATNGDASSYTGFILNYYASPPITPTLPRATPLNSCSGVKNITLTGTTTTIQLGVTNNNTNSYLPFLSCGWIVTVPPYMGLGLTVTNGLSPGGGDRINFYHGASRDPAQLHTTNAFSSTYQVGSMVTYIEFASDGQRSTDLWGFTILLSVRSGFRPCTPTVNLLLNHGSSFGYPSPTGVIFKYGPNIDCSWTVDVGPQVPILLSVGTFSITAGDLVTIYDGNTTINSATTSNFPYISSGPVTVRFRSDASSPLTNGNGFRLLWQLVPPMFLPTEGRHEIPVVQYAVFRFPTPYVASYPMPPGVHDVHWVLTTVPGFTMTVQLSFYLYPSSYVIVYDGDSINAPVLYRYSGFGGSANVVSTCNNATVRLVITDPSALALMKLPSAPNYLQSGLSASVTTSTGLPTLTCGYAPRTTCATSYTITTQADLLPLGQCVWLSGSITFLNVAALNVSLPNITLITGSLSFNGGYSLDQGPSFSFPNLVYVYSFAISGNLYPRNFSFPALTHVYSPTINYIYGNDGPGADFDLVFPSLRATGALSMSIGGFRNISFPQLMSATSVNIQGSSSNLGNVEYINMPLLQNVQSVLTMSYMPGLRAIDVSSVQIIGSTLTMISNDILSSASFPSLVDMASVSIQSCALLTSVQFAPGAVPSGTIILASLGVTTVDFSSMTMLRNTMSVSSNTQLTTLYLSNMLTGFLQLTSNSLLSSLNISSVRSLTLSVSSNAALPTLYMPLLFASAALQVTTGNSQLATLICPAVQYIGTFTLNSLDLVSFSVPNLKRVDTLSVQSTRLASLSFPSLTNTATFSVTQSVYIASVYAPLYASNDGDFTFSDSPAKVLQFPQFVGTAGKILMQGNYQLSALYLCGVRSVGTQIIITGAQSLSCFETRLMFSSLSSQLQMTNFDCNNQLIGSYGCTSNFTRVVNTTGCGFTVPCIQQAIFATYSASGIVVQIPAGTYTNCTVPLNFLGRSMTLQGAGQGVTVVDCQGVGTHLVSNQGETSATVISDMSLVNGFSLSDGGSFNLAGTTMSFTRVTFSNNVAGGRGGAGIVNGGAPSFTGCIFSGNRADSGGALSVVAGGSVNLMTCTMTNNLAYGNGGGLAFVGSANPAMLGNGLLLKGNRAARGGGVFSDVRVQLSDVTMRDNGAVQYGGAMAVVPTAATGEVLCGTQITMTNNTADEGGAVFLYSCSLALTSSTVTYNRATSSGGAISASCSLAWRKLTGIVGPCPFNINVTSTDLSNNAVSAGDGGAMIGTDVFLYLSDVSVTNNFAAQDGGALYVTAANLVVESSSVDSNSADGNGGALYCEARGVCQVTQSTLHDNMATAAGGAVFLCLSSCRPKTGPVLLPDFTGSTLQNNAVGPDGYGMEKATDPAALTWVDAPQAVVVSGFPLSLSTDQSLRVLIQDYYGQTVSSSINVLQLVIASVGFGAGAGQSDTDATLIGTTTVLASGGDAEFSGTAAVAQDAAHANANYSITCRHTSIANVAIVSYVTLLPCGVGQGVPADRAAQGMVCTDCAAGSYSDGSAALLCKPCDPGSYNGQTKQSACTQCAADTFQPASGSLACIACTDGSHAPAGATACSRDPAAITDGAGGGITGSPTVYGIAAGIVVFLIIVCIVVARCVYKQTRRKTMEKYYLDEDATVRRGVSESSLALAVRKLIGASTTTRIGGGEFTDVYKGRHENQWIALKVLKGEMVGHAIAQSEFKREVVALSILSAQKHPGIIELKFFLERSPVCIGLEFCPNGSLKRSLATLSLNVWDKVKMAAQTASAMCVLHNNNIVHMDLKTDNMLLGDDNTIKLADFGICRVLGQGGGGLGSGTGSGGRPDSVMGVDRTSLMSANPIFASIAPRQSIDTNTINGALSSVYATQVDPLDGVESVSFTPQYVDPYRLLHEEDMSDTTLKRADVFTFGMVMWAIYKQEEPFAGVDPILLTEQRRQDPSMRPPAVVDCHKCYDRVMNRAWCSEPAARPSITECLDDLRACLKNHFGADLPEAYLNIGAPVADLGSSGSSEGSKSSHGSDGLPRPQSGVISMVPLQTMSSTANHAPASVQAAHPSAVSGPNNKSVRPESVLREPPVPAMPSLMTLGMGMGPLDAPPPPQPSVKPPRPATTASLEPPGALATMNGRGSGYMASQQAPAHLATSRTTAGLDTTSDLDTTMGIALDIPAAEAVNVVDGDYDSRQALKPGGGAYVDPTLSVMGFASNGSDHGDGDGEHVPYPTKK